MATIEVPDSKHAEDPSAQLTRVNPQMLALTWVAFGIAAYLLYRLAWKPILKAVEIRERTVRKSLDDAERARKELAEAQAKTAQLIADGRAEHDRIVSAARASAEEAAARVHGEAKAQADRLLADAARQIDDAAERARASLRREAGELAVALAGRILGDTVDEARNRAIVERRLAEM